TAEALAEAVAKAEIFSGARAELEKGIVDAQISSITQLFDVRNGGFGQAPKFPHASAIDLVLERYRQTGEKHLLAMAGTTLEKMARGGVSDQVKGGFYASQDADYSLDDDGDYFTWTLEELRGALSSDESRIMELYYDVEPHGEMHHNPSKNVLWIARGAGEIGKTLGLDESQVQLTIAKAKGKMLQARMPRPTPFVDKTMYVSWNAMFVSAYFEGARILPGAVGKSCA